MVETRSFLRPGRAAQCGKEDGVAFRWRVRDGCQVLGVSTQKALTEFETKCAWHFRLSDAFTDSQPF